MKTNIRLMITAAILAAAFFVAPPHASADIGQSLRELFPGGSSGPSSKKIRAEAKDFDITPIADEEGFYHIEASPGTIMGGTMPMHYYIKVKQTLDAAHGKVSEDRSFNAKVRASSADRIYLDIVDANGLKKVVKLKTIDLAKRSAIRDEEGNLRKELFTFKGPKKIVRIDRFINQAGAEGQAILPKNMEQALAASLTESGNFVVVAGKEDTESALAEQDFSVSGRASKGKKTARIGKMQTAQYIINGAITGYASKTKGGGGGASAYGIGVGGAAAKGYLEIALKVVDTTTGTVAFSVKARGAPVSASGSIGGGGGFWGIPVGAKAGGEKIDSADLFVQNCIDNATYMLARKFYKLPWKAPVVKVDGPKVFVRGGTREGIREGTRFQVISLGEPVVDPDTGEVLDDGTESATKKGFIEVIKTMPRMSVCTGASGGPFDVGDIVVFKQ
ncbi:MAG: CsgG/HfaB family protein [Candidatus Tritonobacter lacicola]|nr:CsgG/HfaB family protein [Candidatus Tritonobacter lacicola]